MVTAAKTGSLAWMEHFPIVQALCRTALAQPGAASRKQVKRLRDALVKAGDGKSAAAISTLLSRADRMVEVAPERISRSRADVPSEKFTPRTQVPVDRETTTPLAEVLLTDQLRESPPQFNQTIAAAIQVVVDEWNSFAALQELDVHPSPSCLIYSAPGTGKTGLALWIARQLEMPVILARIDGVVSSFLGTTSRNIGNLFEFANRYRCVLLLDDFDAVAKLRDDLHEVGEIKRVVKSLLQSLDGRSEIGIPKRHTFLDPAVWRRFVVQLEIPRLGFHVRVEIARCFMSPLSAPEEHLFLIAWFTEGATGAETEALVCAYKKSLALRDGKPRPLLDTLKQFATLDSAVLTRQDANSFWLGTAHCSGHGGRTGSSS